MILAAILVAAAEASPTQTPQPTPTPTHPVHLNGALRGYLGCIRAQSDLWKGNPDPTAHIESVMAACAPSLPGAAADVATAMTADPTQAKVLAAYRAKHGSDLDLKPALQQRIAEQARAGALQILSGKPGHASASFRVDFDADGIKPETTTPAPAGDRPAAPAS